MRLQNWHQYVCKPGVLPGRGRQLARRRYACLLMIAAGMIETVWWNRQLPQACNTDAFMLSHVSRRSAVLVSPVLVISQDLMLAPQAHAETLAPQLKPVKSDKGSITMTVPDGWKTETDLAYDKLVFSYTFNNRQLDDYIYIKAEQYNLEKLLKEQNITIKDSSANLWANVLQPPLTADKMALGIVQHSSPRQTTDDVPPREDQVVDAQVLESTDGDGGSALFFHIRSTPAKPAEGDLDDLKKDLPVRYWAAKAVLSNGLVSMSFVNAPEKHWKSSGDPVDGPFLDNIARSLRLSPR